MKVTIITGASSGLGKAFAKNLLNNAKQDDEFWLIARRKDRLDETAADYKNVKIKTFAVDLSDKNSRTAFFDEMKNLNPTIKVLINNAGYEREGKFIDLPLDVLQNIIDVNASGATTMIHECAPFIEKGGYIINTCSVSGFVPNVNAAVYSATKTYLLYLSRVLREEFRERKINVLALCPGNMDTEMNAKKKAEENHSRVNGLPWLNIETIVKKSLKKAKSGKAVYTPGAFYKFYRLAAKIFPQSIMVKFAKL